MSQPAPAAVAPDPSAPPAGAGAAAAAGAGETLGAGEALRVLSRGSAWLLRLSEVREILPHAAPEPLPGAPPEVLGLHNLRGEVLPVLSLDRLLGGSGEVPARFLVVAEGGGVRFALEVEDVTGVVGVAPVASGEAVPVVDVGQLADRVFETETREPAGFPAPEGPR